MFSNNKPLKRQKQATINDSSSSTFRCAVIYNTTAGKTDTYYCEGGWMEGRFVNIINPGSGKTLTLCEVEVYGGNDGINRKINYS